MRQSIELNQLPAAPLIRIGPRSGPSNSYTILLFEIVIQIFYTKLLYKIGIQLHYLSVRLLYRTILQYSQTQLLKMLYIKH